MVSGHTLIVWDTEMNNKVLGILISLVCGLANSNAHGANPFYDIDLSKVKPVSIHNYIDNSNCLKNSSVVCGSNIVRSLSTDIIFFGKFGGLHGLKNWGNTSLKLIPDSNLTNAEYIVKDSQGKPSYKIKFDGDVEIEKVYVATNISNPNLTWQNCVGSNTRRSIEEALNGLPLSCNNLNSSEWLFGLRFKYDLVASVHRIAGGGDLREIQLPQKLQLEVHFDGTNQDGSSYLQDKRTVWFDSGKIKLNDRKCYINLPELKVNFGDLSPTASQANELKSEKLTSIPLYCSGYPTTIEGQDVSINGSGVKSVINGISIQAVTLDEANEKRIAVPKRDNLFVEVGPSQAGVCNASSSVSVNGKLTDIIGPKQENGPVYNQNGYLDATPINLYWRLCQKRPNEPLPSRPLENEVAATIRVHYN